MVRDITDLFLQGLAPPVTGRLEIHDTRVIGLTLRLTASGIATWTVRDRLGDGKRPQPAIGHWPQLSIREARRRARVTLGDIAGGGDPAAEKRQARAERAARSALPTVAVQLAAWRAAKAEAWSPRYAAEVQRLCRKILEPQIGHRLLAETERAVWVGLIAGEREKRPATATWLYQIVSAFSNYAEVCGWLDRPLLPRKGLSVVAPKVPPRQRVLSDDELVAVWRAASARSPRVRCFVYLLILTAARVGEAAGVAVGEIDADRLRWSLPASRAKSGNPITLPLPRFLVGDLLALAPEGAALGHRLLGAARGSALQSISRIKQALDAASGVQNWRLHDLRRSVRTNLAKLGISTEVAEAALNHVGHRTTIERTYNVHTYEEEICRALTLWQEHVAELTGPKLVVSMA
jgi:integrase